MSHDMLKLSVQQGKFRGLPTPKTQLSLIVIRTSPVTRVYRPDFEVPACWSIDNLRPHSDTTKPQARRCLDCPQNIRGSAVDGGKNCRTMQLLAVVFPDKLTQVYQLMITGVSIYGKQSGGLMPLQAYSVFLQQHSLPALSIVTKTIVSTRPGRTPRVLFKPERHATEQELVILEKMSCNDTTLAATDPLQFFRETGNFSPFTRERGYHHKENPNE